MVRYIEVSESVLRDLLGCKSKIEDIKVEIRDLHPRETKRQVIERLRQIVKSSRYEAEGEQN